MKKTLILFALAAMLYSCTMGDKEVNSKDAGDLFNFASVLVTKSINGPADAICRNISDEMFADGFCDTLWARNAGLDYVVRKAPEDDSLWTVSPCTKEDGFAFQTHIRMLPEGLEGHNDLLVGTEGTYQEGDYSAAFRTAEDFFLRWEEESDTYSGLFYSIYARPYGEFDAETYLKSDKLDWCKSQYNGQEVAYTTSKGSGSISRYYSF